MAQIGVNKVILIGNLGKDPEVKYMPSGDAVANVTLATSETWNDKNTGEKKEKTEWHRVVFFGKLAEIVGQYCKKGSKIYVEGQLQTRKWQAQDGSDRYSTEVVVRGFGGTMQMLDSKGSGGGYAPAQPATQSAPQAAPQQAAPAAAVVDDSFDDDIPF